MQTTQQARHHYQLTGGSDKFQAAITVETPEEGIELVHIRLTAEKPEKPPIFQLSWKQPIGSMLQLKAGVHLLHVPPSGVVTFMFSEKLHNEENIDEAKH
jgi:hypothetical protein